MSKRVFVSADWRDPFDSHSWDKEVVDRIRKWNSDSRYGIDIICTDDVHDSVTNTPDCRRCEIKIECGECVKKSSIVVFVVGDKTATKNAGPCDGISCSPAYSGEQKKFCNKAYGYNPISNWKAMSYLEYVITTAVFYRKQILIVYNSVYRQEQWIPSWYNTLCQYNQVNELDRLPFWRDASHNLDCYQEIRRYLI